MAHPGYIDPKIYLEFKISNTGKANIFKQLCLLHTF